MATSSDDKRLYQIALTKINGVGDIIGKNLLRIVGDEEAIFKSSAKALSAIQGISNSLVKEILSPDVFIQAEKELEFVIKNNIQTYFFTDDQYPKRLQDCVDSPILLYFKGDSNFNNEKIISIVGTRNSTHYGNNFCDTFLSELAQKLPNTLIISGLAYGIDIAAHQSAITHGLPTIGVLAHGLDRIYPATHRQIAIEMLNQGGLLTEFPSKTEPDKHNFVRRNRIVAGMADAVLVIESNAKGGSLITAEIANSYCKDVFALPGRNTDKRSEGCNKLIYNHKADILLSASQFIEQMNWDRASLKKEKQPRQQELFLDLSEDEQKIIDKLSAEGATHIDRLSKELSIPAFQLFSTLLELEMRGLIKALPGSIYDIN